MAGGGGGHGELTLSALIDIFSVMLFFLMSTVSFLTLNTSAHDGIAEGYYSGEFKYIGGSLADFSECSDDIGGAVDYVASRSPRIALQGHSLGCDRVLSFALREAPRPFDVILLAPCDSYQLQANWRSPETVEQQIQRLRDQTQLDEFPLLPWSEYGIRQGEGWDYSIPISRRALLRIMEGPPFKLLRLSAPADYHVPGRCLAYIGGKDRLQTAPSQTMFRHISARTADFTSLYIDGGDHMLAGCEREVAGRIVGWLQAGDSTQGER
jgi:hypothetical protein